MDLWQSEVERTCTAECRQRIDGSRDRVLQQRCLSVKCTWQRATLQAHCPAACQMYCWLVVNARYLLQRTASNSRQREWSQPSATLLTLKLVPRRSWRMSWSMESNAAEMSSDSRTVVCRSHADVTTSLTTFSNAVLVECPRQ